jgi:hypothetical protein
MTGVFPGGEMRVGMARVRAVVTSLIARVARGELPVVIDSVYPLAEAAAAHRHIESRAAFRTESASLRVELFGSAPRAVLRGGPEVAVGGQRRGGAGVPEGPLDDENVAAGSP